MRKKIFKNMCLLALVTILLSSLLVTIVYYANSDARMKSEVREETRFVRGAVELSGQDYLATVENTANRITLIDTDGTVLYDNQADPATMENHSDREEFQEASTAGAGEATRISDTIAEQTFYYAVKLQNGQVLRVAATTDSVFAAVLAVLPWILGVEVLVAVLQLLDQENRCPHQPAGLGPPGGQRDLRRALPLAGENQPPKRGDCPADEVPAGETGGVYLHHREHERGLFGAG